MPYSLGKKRWYQTGWGIISAALGAMVLTVGIFFVVITLRYWWQIKQGKGPEIEKEFARSFSVGLVRNTHAPTRVDRGELEATSSVFVGRETAPVVVVEFVDFKCPNCRAAAPIMSEVLRKFGYKVKIIYRHFPVETTHPGATDIAKVVYCAGLEGKFIPLHDYLYSQQDELPELVTDETIALWGEAAQFDAEKVIACFHDPATTRAVNADFFAGVKYGVRGTPTFFINGEKVEGVIPLEWWESFLKKAN